MNYKDYSYRSFDGSLLPFFESMLCRVVYAVLVVGIAWTMDAIDIRVAIALTMALGCIPFLIMLALPRPARPNTD